MGAGARGGTTAGRGVNEGAEGRCTVGTGALGALGALIVRGTAWNDRFAGAAGGVGAWYIRASTADLGAATAAGCRRCAGMLRDGSAKGTGRVWRTALPPAGALARGKLCGATCLAGFTIPRDSTALAPDTGATVLPLPLTAGAPGRTTGCGVFRDGLPAMEVDGFVPVPLNPVAGMPPRVSTCLPAIVPGLTTAREAVPGPVLEGDSNRPGVDCAKSEVGRTSGRRAVACPGFPETGVGL